MARATQRLGRFLVRSLRCFPWAGCWRVELVRIVLFITNTIFAGVVLLAVRQPGSSRA